MTQNSVVQQIQTNKVNNSHENMFIYLLDYLGGYLVKNDINQIIFDKSLKLIDLFEICDSSDTCYITRLAVNWIRVHFKSYQAIIWLID